MFVPVRLLFLLKYFPISVICRYSGRPVLSQSGLYDPTTLLETERIATCQTESWAKLLIYILVFFYSLVGWANKLFKPKRTLHICALWHLIKKMLESLFILFVCRFVMSVNTGRLPWKMKMKRHFYSFVKNRTADWIIWQGHILINNSTIKFIIFQSQF